ncbi:hypothetical protein Tco_0925465 [Tanacetum coccineum]|uniref:Uncharacterized protein n=1 Tax=Tanacetum coccineum TaxID=301880 RepID=A0ABQ5D6X1_9ASTR
MEEKGDNQGGIVIKFPRKFHGYKLATEEEVEENEGLKEVWEQMDVIDDQPMWEIAKTVAPTPNSAIVQINVDDNFVINSTHLNMIRENKFDGYLRADSTSVNFSQSATCSNMAKLRAKP